MFSNVIINCSANCYLTFMLRTHKEAESHQVELRHESST